MSLDFPLSKITKLNDFQKKAFERFGIKTCMDLLYYFPTRYGHITNVKLIKSIGAEEDVAIYGKVEKLELTKGFKSKIPMAKARVRDESGIINVVWFNQAYIAKMFAVGDMVELVGKTGQNKSGIYLANPEMRKVEHLLIDTHDSLFENNKSDVFGYPVYKESNGLTSKMIYYLIQKIFKLPEFKTLQEYLPKEILDKYRLPDLKTSLIWIHSPKKEDHAIRARKRFSFEEIFFIQLEKQKQRLYYQNQKTFIIKPDKKRLAEFEKRLGFKFTVDQKEAVETILKDISNQSPMSRLLEGDVGSGKTAVAGAIVDQIIHAQIPDKKFEKLTIAYMAPTEILAKQLFENFIKYFNYSDIQIGLITSSGAKKFPSKINNEKWTDISKTQLLKWVESGQIPVLIGTHSLIQKNVKFKNLALVIIDEQHRFGTLQRQKLVQKQTIMPHLLSMTATPIPRTLALTIYGDLDLSIIQSMPEGRQKIETSIVQTHERAKVYEHIRNEIKAGRQAYIICPRIDDDQEGKMQMRSVISETERLSKNELKGFKLEYMHSKMTKQDKEEVMFDFLNKKIDVLVSTSVVEVGVNIPDASIIVIEGSERFGLAQLHQLRGRVLRGNHKPYCYLFYESNSEKTKERLSVLTKASNGFELAEQDLKMRGSGELTGGKQWGITDLAMEALKNIKMVEYAKEEAKDLVAKDLELTNYPLLKKVSKEKIKINHLE